MSGPELKWTHEAEEPRGAVLVLHGGKSNSQMATNWWNLAILRMMPFAWSLASESAGALSVAVLRYAVRGWNGSAASPVASRRVSACGPRAGRGRGGGPVRAREPRRAPRPASLRR